MKTKIFYLLTLCLAFVACNNSTENENKADEKTINKTDLEKQVLEGDIASINEIEYYADVEMPDSMGELYSRKYLEFDKKGYQVLSESYGSIDNLINRNVREFDDYGFIEKEEIYDGFTGEFSHESKYDYDESGKILKIESCDKEKDFFSETIYEYDEDGNLSAICSRFGNNNDDQFRTEYKYNDYGNIIYSYSQDFTNCYFRIYYYDYFDNGLLCNKLVLTDDEKVILDFTYEYQYDCKENWIKRIETDRGRVTHITVREIDYR